MAKRSQTPVTETPAPSVTPMKRTTLQRRCACGAPVCDLVGECEACSTTKMAGMQTKVRINAPGDASEQEADRVAGQVLANPAHPDVGSAPPHIQRYTGQSSGQMSAAPAGVDRALASPARPLDPALRQAMEQRFGHDFSAVRVHVGSAAEQSARELHASAYTLGRDVVFGAGRFEPQTQQGQRLIAHELTHVVQQSGSAGASLGQTAALIQRQPDEISPKKDAPKTQPAQKTKPAQKTLKGAGVDVTDPVAKGTSAIIDEVLARNQRLAPYIGDKLTAGFKIAEKGKFIHDTSDANFDSAYQKAYGLNSSTMVPKDTIGFVDPNTSEIHLRPDAQFGTALHEAVHRLASPNLYKQYLSTAGAISTDLAEVLKEGMTAFFTDCILKDEDLPNYNDAYRGKKEKVKNLVSALGSDGFDLIAKFNFKASTIVEIGEKLGFTRAQYVAAKNDGIREVLKRMEQAM
jgi:hypothetical protein